MIPQTIVIGIIVAIIGYYLQQRAWKHKLIEDTRQREFEECLKLIDSLSRAIDKRLMALSSFRREVNKGNVTPEELESYRESVKDWMHEFSSFKSKLFHYYGADKAKDFEMTVHAKLRESSDIILRTYRFGKKGLSSRDRQEFEKVQSLINIARHQSFEFLNELNEGLANGEIGRTAMFNNVEVGHLEMLSRSYLIQRLFGLKP